MKSYDRIMINALAYDLGVPASFVTEFYIRYMSDWIEPDVDPKPKPLDPPDQEYYDDEDCE